MKKKWRLTQEMIEFAPDARGVYALWKGDEIIYFGRAEGGSETLRSRLLEHLQRGARRCVNEATHYSWEISRQPAVRESELLSEFWLARGCFPRCNEDETVERVVKQMQAGR
jgi:hypothetical protein